MNAVQATTRALFHCPDRTVKCEEGYWSTRHTDPRSKVERTEGSEFAIYILPGLNGEPCQSFRAPSFECCLANLAAAIVTNEENNK